MDFHQARFNMVEQQIRPWDVLDFDVLDAIESIPREKFVLPEQWGYAYADLPLKLANGGYMLEPKIIARMIQGLALTKTERILEVGTGSGYATAILATLGKEVHSFDIDPRQQTKAKEVLNELNFQNIHFEDEDGLNVGDNHGIYDAIYIGGGVETLPELLKLRLRENGGRMVVIVGTAPVQRCLLITRNGSEFTEKVLFDTMVSGLNSKAAPKVNKFTF